MLFYAEASIRVARLTAGGGRAVASSKAHDRNIAWLPRTRVGKVALGLDLGLAAFPLWIVPSWYLVTFLAGAGGMFESPRAVTANSVFQSIVLAATLAVNLVALLRAKDHSILLALAVIPLSGVVLYMGWFAAANGLPGAPGGH